MTQAQSGSAIRISRLQAESYNLNDEEVRLLQSLDNLARRHDLTAYLQEFLSEIDFASTNSNFRVHLVRRDGNDRLRINDLAKKLAAQAIDYCIPRSRVLEALADSTAAGKTEKIIRLYEEARSLFSKQKTSGEGGELLLFMLLEGVLGIPQVLCKMPLKTNSQVHVHGTDGIHAAVDPDSGNLAVYWGESKLYRDFASAASDCFKSIAPFLDTSQDGDTPAKRDLELLRDNLDLADPQLQQAFKSYLDPDSPSFLKRELRGACLIGFDYDTYPRLQVKGTEFQADPKLTKEISKWKKALETRIRNRKLLSVKIEVFCIPFPSVAAFRDRLKKELIQL